MLARYRKTVVALLGAVAAAVTAALTDGSFTPAEGVGVVLAVLTVFGVYATPNEPPPTAAESWVAKRLATDERFTP
jgi:hypothetical protein